MAYTPQGSYNDEYIRSQNGDDWKAIERAKAEYTTAFAAGDKAGMKAANEYANSIRGKYGYSGGTDGSQYISMSSDKASQSKSSDLSAYTQLLNESLNQALTANQHATNDSISRLGGRIDEINDAYDALLKESEVNNILEQENIRRSSVLGNFSSTGMPDTLKTAQSAAYQQNRNSSAIARSKAIGDIYDDMESAMNQGYQNEASIRSGYQQQLADVALQQLLLGQNRAWQVEDRDYNAALAAYERQLQTQIEQEQAERNRGWSVEDRDFSAEQLIERLMLQAQIEQDQAERNRGWSLQDKASANAIANQKSQRSTALTLLKAGYYSPELARLAGLSDAAARSLAGKDESSGSSIFDMLGGMQRA